MFIFVNLVKVNDSRSSKKNKQKDNKQKTNVLLPM